MNLITRMSLSFVLRLALVHDYSNMSLMLDYHFPCTSFPCSATAEERLVVFSPGLHNTSFIIKGLCSFGGYKKKGSKLNVYLIVGQELAPVEMLAEGNAVKHTPSYKCARKPRGRW